MELTENKPAPSASHLKTGSGLSSEEVFVFPTTIAQRRFWLLDQLTPGNPALNVPLAARLTGRLDRELLERAVNEILRRHEILRTSFRTLEKGLVQVIHSERTIRLAWFDLVHYPEAEREVQANRLMLEEGKRSFVLTEGPFLHGGLIKLRDNEHILMLTMHHIVCDGWSNGILMRELAQIYTALIEGGELAELPLQYADFAQWQADWLASPAIVEQRQFWKSQLHGILPFLNLPTDRPRKAVRTNNSAIHTLLLPLTLTDALKDLCVRESLTPFMLFFSAYATLLYRYTGQRDVIVGSPAANRSQADVEGLIGLFSNPLVMRLNFSDNLTFRTLLARVRELSLAVFDHQMYPFEKVLEEIQTDPRRAGLPWLQAYLIFQKAFMLPQHMPGVTLTPLRSVSPGTMFEWMLGVMERTEGMRLQLEYNTDLYDQSTIDRMLHHFQLLLETVLVDLDVQLDELPILVSREHQKLILDWNEAQLEIPRDRLVHELFEEQVQRTPDAPAVCSDDSRVSYAQLNSQANQTAHFLRSRGVGPGSRVGLAVDEYSIKFLAGYLGILKAGGCCVVLEPRSDAADIERLVAESRLDVLIVGSTSSPRLKTAAGSPIVEFEADAKSLDGQPDHNLSNSVPSDQPACVFFTAGTSGAKKGAVISHRALLNSARGAMRELDLHSHDCVAFSTNEMLPALLAGAVLVLPARNDKFSAEDWLQWVRSQKVTVAALPTACWHELLQTFARDPGKISLAELRLLAIGGSRISPSALSVWQRATAGRIRLLDRYLLAEMAGAAAFTDLRMTDSSSVRASIIRPAPNARIYLLDAKLQPVPIGVPGNLYVGGMSLATGYLVGSEPPAAGFIPDRFSGKPGARLLKTGDCGRFLAGGGIELLGRLEDLEKTNGFRLELCEVWSTIMQHPGVWDAVVIPQEISGKKKLFAYWVNQENTPVQSVVLRAFVADRLPAYMVPAAFVPLPSLPLTPGGKIDRQALPIPTEQERGLEAQSMAPGNPTEAALAKIWREILGSQPIGVRDNFFALGGHSLMAVRLVNEINRLFHHNLPIPTFFRNPTIEKIARIIQQETHASREPKLVPLQSGDPARSLFFLDAGVGLCRLAQLLPGGPASFATTVPLSAKAFRAATLNHKSDMPSLEELAAVHTALIQDHQPSGSCLLAGHSFGGLLAFEVANQLQRAGREVEMILLLDSWASSPPWWRRLKALNLSRARKSLQFRAGHWWSKTWPVMAHATGRLFQVKHSSAALAPALDYANQPFSDVPWKIMKRVYQHARKNYRLRPVESRAVFFRAQDSSHAHLYRIDAHMGWDGLFTGGLKIVDTPGDHFTLLKEPHLTALAQQFKRLL